MKKDDLKPQGFGKQIPPKKESVYIYFAQKGLPESEAERFFKCNEGRHWQNGNGKLIQNWKTLACEWTWKALHK